MDNRYLLKIIWKDMEYFTGWGDNIHWGEENRSGRKGGGLNQKLKGVSNMDSNAA